MGKSKKTKPVNKAPEGPSDTHRLPAVRFQAVSVKSDKTTNKSITPSEQSQSRSMLYICIAVITCMIIALGVIIILTVKIGNVECLQDKVKDLKTSLHEERSEYDKLQDDFREEWQEKEHLKLENQAQNKTIETKNKELNDLKQN